MDKLLITGGCGFVGSHIIEHLLKNTDWEIIIIDRLDFTSSLERLTDIDVWEDQKFRVKFIWWDLKAEFNQFLIDEIKDVNYIWHLAASSHVDRSIIDPLGFVMDNVVGTCNLLNFARLAAKKLERFIYFSCYDSKTRALTKDGLKKYNELKNGDIVFTLNEKTKKVEEQKVEKVLIQNYSGEMIKFDNKRINLLTTPNHRIYKSDMNVLEAGDCINKKIKFPISMDIYEKNWKLNPITLDSST